MNLGHFEEVSDRKFADNLGKFLSHQRTLGCWNSESYQVSR